MKSIIVNMLLLLSVQSALVLNANATSAYLNTEPFHDRNLVYSVKPTHYHKRESAVLNIGLIYYGGEFNVAYLDRISSLLEERFYLATDKQISLNILVKEVIPYRYNIVNYPEYTQPQITDLERLQRLWYFDNVGYRVAKEVHKGSKKNKNIRSVMRKLDALAVVTGAQFEALGFAEGRIAVTENPREIAWGLDDGGRVEIASDFHVVDELIHEIGHTLYLDHASKQCQLEGLTLEQKAACCLVSPAKDDVMSYCRSRDSADETHFHKFEACNLKFIKEKIVPALLSGGVWAIPGAQNCQ